mmetsp:Transcript_6777/g.28856  ORF Transcript_6777/g.28856 Transcript_6777/m.28856 type:complete len:123 (+) Transcript_6777:1252-1620(+)
MAALSMSAASISFGRNVADARALRVSAPTVNAVVPRQSLKTEAMVKIRFTRLGRIRSPFYRIIAIDSRKRRDGAPLEELGWYDPIKKQSNLNAPAIKAWLAKGAQPSETVGALLRKSLIIEK